ncbi:hypothetical protein CCR95_10800 [Thiocystis minor]|nr:hypothetical protein [Thiocystis minor]
MRSDPVQRFAIGTAKAQRTQRTQNRTEDYPRCAAHHLAECHRVNDALKSFVFFVPFAVHPILLG